MHTTRNRMVHWLGALGICLAFVLCTAAEVGAQGLPGLPGGAEADSAPSEDPKRPEAIAERLATVVGEIAAVDQALPNLEPRVARHVRQVRNRLRAVEALLEQQAPLAASPDSPAFGLVETASTMEAAEPSPFALNALYEFRFIIERRSEALATSREALAQAKQEFDAAERSRRQAQSELEQAELEDRERAARMLELRRLDSGVAQETVNLRKLEMYAVQQDKEMEEARGDIEDRIQALRERLARGEGNARAGFTALAEREGELRRSREATERRLATAELKLVSAQKRFSKQADPSAALLGEVEALTSRRDAVRQEIALADARLDRLGAQRTIWRRWDLLLSGDASREDLEAWEAATSERIELLKQAELERRGRASDLQRRIEVLEKRYGDLLDDTRIRPVLEEQAETLRRLYEEQLAEVAALASDVRLSERLLHDIRTRTGNLDPLQYATQATRVVGDVWRYELTAIDDAPITVGSVLLALGLFGIGLWGSRRGSSAVGRVAADRLNLDAGAVHALQTLSFYALLVGFTLLALRAVHFPLTAFTVLGGALAIGIGFGSQNVMNNFISGLILMLERPVRARDVVEVDGNHGTIESIGARSTQIRSTDGRHMVVPNSFFLESNVVNWTLSDDLIRAKVTVGVIYGSPTRLVAELIRVVVDEDERVLKNPKPIIIFEEFGDNSLNFDVYFWVRARSPMDVRGVQSEVRFRIDDLFRANDLVIAFPQRDVHLDSASPLEIRMLNEDSRPARDTPPDHDRS